MAKRYKSDLWGTVRRSPAIAANVLLLPLAALFFAPWVVVPYVALLIVLSEKNGNLRQIWIDYYRTVTRIEYKLLKQ